MKLPVVSGKEVVKALSKSGFYFISQKGSHVKLRKITPDKVVTVVVPMHRVVSKGTLRDIINDAGLTIEEFSNRL